MEKPENKGLAMLKALAFDMDEEAAYDHVEDSARLRPIIKQIHDDMCAWERFVSNVCSHPEKKTNNYNVIYCTACGLGFGAKV